MVAKFQVWADVEIYMMYFSFPSQLFFSLSQQLCCFGENVVFVLKIHFLINLLLQEATILSIVADARRTRKRVKTREQSR